jgi:hypothetical protein
MKDFSNQLRSAPSKEREAAIRKKQALTFPFPFRLDGEYPSE